jgi:hypothetical protein
MTRNQNFAVLTAIGTLSFSATWYALALNEKRKDRLEDRKANEFTQAYMKGWRNGFNAAKNDPILQHQHYLDFKASMTQ